MKFIWPDTARADLRAIDRESAVRILQALTRFGDSGDGDVKALSGEWHDRIRLRIGDYRVILQIGDGDITVERIRHRSEVYR